MKLASEIGPQDKKAEFAKLSDVKQKLILDYQAAKKLAKKNKAKPVKLKEEIKVVVKTDPFVDKDDDEFDSVNVEELKLNILKESCKESETDELDEFA